MGVFSHCTDQPEASFLWRGIGENIAEGNFFSRFDPTCVFSKENSQELESEYENGHSNKTSRCPIRSQRCTSSALLGVHQESSQRSHRAWKLNSEFTPENIPSHKERIVLQGHHFAGVNSLLNFGVYVNPNFPTPIFCVQMNPLRP